MQFQWPLTNPKPWPTVSRWVPRLIVQAAQSAPQPTVYGLACRTGIKAGQSESTYTVTYTSPSPRVVEE